MLDIKFIREHTEQVRLAAQNKGVNFDVDRLLAVDARRRELMQKSETVRAEKKRTQERELGTKLKNEFKELEAQLQAVEEEFNTLMAQVPNIPSEDTPIGKTAEENVEVYHHGKLPEFRFTPKDHIELAKALDIIDFERGAKVAGYRGYYLKGAGAQLAMALMQFA